MLSDERLLQIQQEIDNARNMRDCILTPPVDAEDLKDARALDDLIVALKLERDRILESK